MTAADLLLDRGRILTIDDGASGPLCGDRQGHLGTIEDGALAIRGGRIVAVGPRDAVLPAVRATEVVDLGGRTLLPGFVDAHAHPLWAGDRVSEFERRVGGATYLEIMAAGGGIASTVRATRAADDETLLGGLMERLDLFVGHGTTTLEAKSGYGLSVAEELRHLRLIEEADRRHPVRVVPTFLGAHAVPEEYGGRADAYIDLVVDEMLPEVARRNPTVFCDVFCDDGAFTREQTARVLRRAAQLGLPLKIHSDEFANLGCTGLAASLGAVSADHLSETRPEEMAAMAAAGTVAVLLPGTSFGLGSGHYADGRSFVANGVAVALGTDHNPGTCPCESMPFMLALATRYVGLTPAEAVVAATRNAACATGRGARAGRLAVGWDADMVVLTTRDYRDLAYRFGGSLLAGVMIDGTWVRPLQAAAAT